MAQIQPIQFPLSLGTANDLNVRTSYMNMEATTCMIVYELRDTSAPLPGANNFKILNTGTFKMDEQSYLEWGADNSYVIQWVANKLGVTLV